MNIELPLDGKQRARLRPVSKGLFHSEYALEAFLLILQEPRVYSAQVAGVTGCQPNFAGSLLRRLETGGLVEALPLEEGQRRHYFRRRPSPIWDPLLEMIGLLLQEPESEVTRLPKRS
jgi:hypothetical protein